MNAPQRNGSRIGLHGARSRQSLRTLAVILMGLIVSACAGIPTSGPVTKVVDDAGFGESTVRYSPARPSRNASPQQIVSGYLDAMLAYPVSTGTAAAFLTPRGAKGWNPSDQVRIYSSSEVFGARPAARTSGDVDDGPDPSVDVRLGLVEDARLDRQGHFARQARPSEITYRLERVKGEWRIANPQAGVLVNRKFFDDYFRPFSIFFFDRPGERLVPDPVHLVVGDQLATSLVTSLSRGPRASDLAASRTYVPAVDALRPSVPISGDGVADVQFDTDLNRLAESVRDRLSAQVVWTLRQVPDIVTVRLTGGSTPLGEQAGLQDVTSWGAFGPSIARGHAYAVADGAVVQIDEDDVRPLSGPWGRDARGARSIAVSDAGVAAVLGEGNVARITNRKGAAVRTVDGSRFITPRWDESGKVWLVDRDGARTRVRVVDGSDVTTLRAAGLARLDPSTFELSPDGARYAVTVGRGARSAIMVGSVLRSAKNEITGLADPYRVFTGAGSPSSATWSSGTRLSYLAASESGRQVYTSAIDGSATSGGVDRGDALLPDVGARTLAIGTGEGPARYVTDADNRLWYLPPGESWQRLPIKKVTGLTYGR